LNTHELSKQGVGPSGLVVVLPTETKIGAAGLF